MEEARLLAFWGKTLRSSDNSSGTIFNNTEGQRSYKPVLHHLMDVALLKASPECLSKITAFLAGIHDIGKFSRGFQAKVSELWPEQVLGPKREISDRPHWGDYLLLATERRLTEAH